MRFALPLLLPFIASCGPSLRPCADCPPIEGTWRGAFDAVSGASCSAASLPGSLDLTLERNAAALSGQLGTLRLSGTVYDTWDFGLTAAGQDPNSATALTWRIRGRYIAGAAGNHAADTLQGTYQPVGADSGDGGICGGTATFSATRT